MPTIKSPRDAQDPRNNLTSTKNSSVNKTFKVTLKNQNPYGNNNTVLRQTVQKNNSSYMTQKVRKNNEGGAVSMPMSTLEQRYKNKNQA